MGPTRPFPPAHTGQRALLHPPPSSLLPPLPLPSQAAYGKQLPFPLSYTLPWSQQRAVRRKFEGADPAALYSEAGEALEALANHLTATSGSGNFFLGRQPTSLGGWARGRRAGGRVGGRAVGARRLLAAAPRVPATARPMLVLS